MKFKIIKNFKTRNMILRQKRSMLYLLTSIFKKRFNAFKKRNN